MSQKPEKEPEKKQKTTGLEKKDYLVKKMPHPAVDFDRDKNSVYLPQDESIESFDHRYIGIIIAWFNSGTHQEGQMNPHMAKEKWKEIKGRIIKSWGEITDDELEQTRGDLEKLTGLVQKKYGETKESVRDRLDRFIKSVKTNNKNEQPRLKK